jgi:hypothetical protein
LLERRLVLIEQALQRVRFPYDARTLGSYVVAIPALPVGAIAE